MRDACSGKHQILAVGFIALRSSWEKWLPKANRGHPIGASEPPLGQRIQHASKIHPLQSWNQATWRLHGNLFRAKTPPMRSGRVFAARGDGNVKKRIAKSARQAAAIIPDRRKFASKASRNFLALWRVYLPRDLLPQPDCFSPPRRVGPSLRCCPRAARLGLANGVGSRRAFICALILKGIDRGKISQKILWSFKVPRSAWEIRILSGKTNFLDEYRRLMLA